MVTLLAAFAGKINGGGQGAIGSARAELACLCVPAIGENVGEYVIARRDAEDAGLQGGSGVVSLNDGVGGWSSDFNAGRCGWRSGGGRVLAFVDLDGLAERGIGHAKAKNVMRGKLRRDGGGHLPRVVADAAVENDVIEEAVSDGGGIGRRASRGIVMEIERIDDLPLMERRRKVVTKDSVIDEDARGWRKAVLKICGNRFGVGPKDKLIDMPRAADPAQGYGEANDDDG